MTNYTEREVKTSIRRLHGSINDVVNASYATYKSKIKSFIELTNTDAIIHSIVNPFRKLEVDLNEIYASKHPSFIYEVKLPSDVESRIASVIKIFDDVTNDEVALDSFASKIYRYKSYDSNVKQFLNDIAKPQLIELIHMLNDLMEYEVQGKEIVSESALQIINHGTITAHQGSSISMGKDIQTTINYNLVANEIMEEVRRQEVVSSEKLPEVEIISNDLQQELLLPEPNPGKLKQLAQKAYEVGEQGLLKVITTVVNDPRWGQAVAETIMNIN